MFEAYILEDVVTKLPFDATLITASIKKDKLLVGSKQGHLLNCHPSEKASSAKKSSLFEYSVCRNFQNKISELAIIESHGIILSVNGEGILSAHNIDEPSILLYKVDKYKPISAFSWHIKKENNFLLVAIASKKRLVILKWLVTEFEYFTDLALTSSTLFGDNTQRIAWVGSSTLISGARNAYYFIRLCDSNESSELRSLNSSSGASTSEDCVNRITPLLFDDGTPIRYDGFPLIVALPHFNSVGLSCISEGATVVAFVDGLTGNSLSDLVQCCFSNTPLSLAFDYPFLLGCLPKGTVEVRSVRPSLLIQRISLNKVSLITIGQPGSAYVASESTIWMLNSRRNVLKNIQFLVDGNHFELAIVLADSNQEMVDELTRISIKRRMAQQLFGLKRFNECFDVHLKLKTNVLLVINFFHDLVPDKYIPVLSKFAPKELQPFELPLGCDRLSDEDRTTGIFALGQHLTMRRQDHEQQIRRHYMNRTEGQSSDLLSVQDLKRNESILELIDTVLLKCHLISNPQLVGPLLRSRWCSCLVAEAEADLSKNGRSEGLLILYWRRKMYRKALELIKREFHSDDGSVLANRTTAVQKLAMHLKILVPSNLPLVFEYAPIVLKQDIVLGVKIFTHDACDGGMTPDEFSSSDPTAAHWFPSYAETGWTANRELDRSSTSSGGTFDANSLVTHPESEKIIDFLRRECRPALIPYLEHIIGDGTNPCESTNPRFHQILLEEYVNRIRLLFSEYTQYHSEVDARQGDELSKCRSKLQTFLSKSAHYDPFQAHFIIKSESDLVEELAIVLGKMGRHDEAIYIYTNCLMDFCGAEDHCIQYYDPDNPSAKNLYFILFEAYALPAQLEDRLTSSGAIQNSIPTKLLDDIKVADRSRPANTSEALRVLRKHADVIDTVSALSLIPDETPFHRVWTSLRAVFESLQNKTTSLRLSLAASGLAVRHTADHLHTLRNASVLIDNTVECLICNKRIGDSAFVRLEGNSIVHVFCYNSSKRATRATQQARLPETFVK